MTPEGKVKARVKDILAQHGSYVWSEWPVPGGYGKSGLDCHGCANGHFFAIETKAPGKDLTGRQRQTALDMIRAYGTVFVISNESGLHALDKWLHSVVSG